MFDHFRFLVISVPQSGETTSQTNNLPPRPSMGSMNSNIGAASANGYSYGNHFYGFELFLCEHLFMIAVVSDTSTGIIVLKSISFKQNSFGGSYGYGNGGLGSYGSVGYGFGASRYGTGRE